MKPLFADTFYYFALLIHRDPAHSKAVAAIERLPQQTGDLRGAATLSIPREKTHEDATGVGEMCGCSLFVHARLESICPVVSDYIESHFGIADARTPVYEEVIVTKCEQRRGFRDALRESLFKLL